MTRTEPLDHRNAAVAQSILDVLRPAYAQEARLLRVQPSPPLQRSAADIQASSDWHLGAWVDARLVGVLGLGPDDEAAQLNIKLLVVHPDWQRQGLARALVLELLRRSAGMAIVVSTTAANAPALALYRRLGFVDHRRGSIGPEGLALLQLRRPAD